MIRSPTCRIFAKDLRRFWPLLLSAAALDAFGVLMPLGTTNSTYYGGVTTSDAVMYVRWFVMAFVAVAMAQDDSPSGDRGSWLARPITPGAVLGAKVCMLGLGLALPAGLAAAGAAFMVHAGPGILLASVFGMGSTVFLVGAAFLFLGSLTASLLQASLATVVFFVLKSLTAQSLWAFEGLLRPTSTELGQLPALPSERTMAVVSLVSAVVALSAVLVHQFFTRRTRRTLQLSAGLAAAAWLTPALWNWEPFPSRQKPHGIPGPPPVGMVCVDPHGFLGTVNRRAFPQRDGVVVTVRVRQTGGPSGPQVRVKWARSRFLPAGGEPYVMPQPVYQSPFISIMDLDSHSNEPQPYFFSALGAAPMPDKPKVFSEAVLELPRATYGLLQGASGKIDTYIDFGDYKLAPLASISLRPGAQVFDKGQMWRLRSYFLLPRGTVVLDLDSIALKSEWPSSHPVFSNYVLVNRAQREFSTPDTESFVGQTRTDFIERFSFEFTFQRTWSLDSHSRTAGIDEAWLAQAELELLTESEVAHEVMDFHWDGIVMPTTPVKN